MTRRFRSTLVLLVAILALALINTVSAQTCTVDGDCATAQICVGSQCVCSPLLCTGPFACNAATNTCDPIDLCAGEVCTAEQECTDEVCVCQDSLCPDGFECSALTNECDLVVCGPNNDVCTAEQECVGILCECQDVLCAPGLVCDEATNACAAAPLCAGEACDTFGFACINEQCVCSPTVCTGAYACNAAGACVVAGGGCVNNSCQSITISDIEGRDVNISINSDRRRLTLLEAILARIAAIRERLLKLALEASIEIREVIDGIIDDITAPIDIIEHVIEDITGLPRDSLIRPGLPFDIEAGLEIGVGLGPIGVIGGLTGGIGDVVEVGAGVAAGVDL